jgi:predicted component of type VI protein secretion system
VANESFQIVVRKGPRPGQLFPITEDVISVGRDPLSDIVLEDAEVSRHHARLTMTAAGYELQDLGSTNGTFVDGQRLSGEPISLQPGQVVMFGSNVTVIYQATAEDDALATVVAPAATVEPPAAEQPATTEALDEDLIIPEPEELEPPEPVEADPFPAYEDPVPLPAYEDPAPLPAYEEPAPVMEPEPLPAFDEPLPAVEPTPLMEDDEDEHATMMEESPFAAAEPPVTDPPPAYEPAQPIEPAPMPTFEEPAPLPTFEEPAPVEPAPLPIYEEPAPMPEPLPAYDPSAYQEPEAPARFDSGEAIPEYESPPPQDFGDGDKDNGGSDRNRNIIIAVVVVILLCCCCLLISLAIGFSQGALDDFIALNSQNAIGASLAAGILS